VTRAALMARNTRHAQLLWKGRLDMQYIFWAYAAVWVLNILYLASIASRQTSLRREIDTLKAMAEQKQK
jgi:CcmD family protein